jgi:ABC-2 type transport system permease protein
MSLTAGNSNELRIIAARRSNRIHVQEIWQYRELLLGLVNKELKVRYKNSVLGFFWSMAQPVFLLLVYGVAFSILKAGFDKFAVWLMCGLIVWTFAGTTLSTSVQSITANQHLVSKVSFPRAVLPLASLGASLVHFFLQSVAFGIVLIVLRHPVDWSYVWLLPIAAAVLTMFLSSLALLLSTVNVYARDTQHLLDLALQGMFWAIPVLYEYQRVANWFVARGWPSWTPLLNPFTPVVITFQRAVYGTAFVGDRQLLPDTSQWWYLRNLGVLALVSLVLISIGLRAFDKAEGNFAEIL